jgi:muramoyltetrapeptide carboxypeptidase
LSKSSYRIAVVAPAGTLRPEVPTMVQDVAASLYPDGGVDVVFHPQCFLIDGHFAGSDAERTAAFIEVANDQNFDAVWFARGGYGSCRVAPDALPQLGPAARAKAYLGYSDLGALLAGLYGRGFERVAHGPMAQDILRDGGEQAVRRALQWLVEGSAGALEASDDDGAPKAAFNIAVLSHILGTPLQPDLTGHVLMLEEIAEYMYRIDRYLFHITSDAGVRRAKGLRLGRCSLIPPNDPDFVREEEEVMRYWCERSGLAFLGRADIGHDSDNKVVPFGRAPTGTGR